MNAITIEERLNRIRDVECRIDDSLALFTNKLFNLIQDVKMELGRVDIKRHKATRPEDISDVLPVVSLTHEKTIILEIQSGAGSEYYTITNTNSDNPFKKGD